jgi:hypothetical protein
MGWLTLVLWLDHVGGREQQRVLGVLTWLVLLTALRGFAPMVRAQTVVVVAFATVVEYTFSAGLGVYLYRFPGVPAYVPPGHGLVYLSACALGQSPWVRRHLRLAVTTVVVGLGTWAAYGVLLAPRRDALGAIWFCCLLAFMRWGPSLEVYVGAAVVVTWLELAGTTWGTWAWQPHDPVGWLSIGNPPSGAAGGYGWFDLAGLLAAPLLLRGWVRVRDRAVALRGRPARDPREDVVAP